MFWNSSREEKPTEQYVHPVMRMGETDASVAEDFCDISYAPSCTDDDDSELEAERRGIYLEKRKLLSNDADDEIEPAQVVMPRRNIFQRIFRYCRRTFKVWFYRFALPLYAVYWILEAILVPIYVRTLGPVVNRLIAVLKRLVVVVERLVVLAERVDEAFKRLEAHLKERFNIDIRYRKIKRLFVDLFMFAIIYLVIMTIWAYKPDFRAMKREAVMSTIEDISKMRYKLAVLEEEFKFLRNQQSFQELDKYGREAFREQLTDIVVDMVNGALNKAVREGHLMDYPHLQAELKKAKIDTIPTMSNSEVDLCPFPDYAQHNAGGRVYVKQTGHNYPMVPTSFYRKVLYYVLGQPTMRGPEKALTPGRELGECWAIEGEKGRLTVNLGREIYVEGFAIDHIDSRIAFDKKSAPKDVELWAVAENQGNIPEGWTADDEEWGGSDVLVRRLGKFMYDIEKNEPVQKFWLDESMLGLRVRAVQLRILSNSGLEDFTCLYRFRVFGTAADRAAV